MIPARAAAVVLDRAKAKVGGVKALAEILGVSVEELQRYSNAEDPVPETVYLKAVDIVLGPASDSH